MLIQASAGCRPRWSRSGRWERFRGLRSRGRRSRRRRRSCAAVSGVQSCPGAVDVVLREVGGWCCDEQQADVGVGGGGDLFGAVLDDRRGWEAGERHLHVGLPGGEPDVADEDVGETVMSGCWPLRMRTSYGPPARAAARARHQAAQRSVVAGPVRAARATSMASPGAAQPQMWMGASRCRTMW